MATVTKWTPFGVALDITATAGTIARISATQFTVKINASWKVHYSGASTNYGMIAHSGNGSVNLNTSGNTASSGSGSFTGTFSISGNGSLQTTITVEFDNYNSDKSKSETNKINLPISVPAWTSYAIKYDANGGSGVPSSQTKWKDQTLTLSSTKPTRTGYSFQGWATSANGAVAYLAGASYTSNSAVTLYAVWKANTYTISYNANGGYGAPGNQIKSYGTALTLSSTIPTKENYNFLGWGTSASATTVAYSPGASYTSNSAVTLYAIWELAYTAPRITGISVSRCNSEGKKINSGTYALVNFDWVCDEEFSSIIVEWISANNSGSTIISGTGTSGTVNKIVGNGDLLSNITYTIKITVADSIGESSAKRTLKSESYLIHGMPGNKGIAFGKSAEIEDTADFEYEILSRKATTLSNDKSIMGIDTDGTQYSALIPVTASGNTSLGYGLYKAKKGYTHIYGNMVRFYTNDGVHFNDNKAIFNNNTCIYGTKPDGTVYEAINLQNASGNLVFGFDNYDLKNGLTNIYGYDINFGVSNIASPATFKPYYRRGDTITINTHTSGYVTNNGKEVHFMVHLAKPIVGTPTVSLVSDAGFIIRQDAKYTHGSSATVSISPDTYQGFAQHAVGVRIIATFTNTTNVINNAPCGVHWTGFITLS